MLDENTSQLRNNLFRVTRTDPETVEPSFDPEKFAWLEDFVRKQLAVADIQGKPVNKVELITALMLDFEELYKAYHQLMKNRVTLGLHAFELAKQRTVVVEQRTKAGFSSGQQRLAERKAVWSEWQSCADSYWTKNPNLSKAQVGQMVAKQRGLGENPDTIRKYIKKAYKKT